MPFRAGLRIIKSFFSEKILSELYDIRRVLRPSEENRSLISLTICGVLFASTLVYLLSQAWLRQDVNHYLSSRAEIDFVEDSSIEWVYSPSFDRWCSSPRECFEMFSALPTSLYKSVDLETIEFEALANQGEGFAEERILQLSKIIPVGNWKRFQRPHSPVVLGLPSLRYRRADLFIENQLIQSFYRSERLAVPLDAKFLDKNTLKIDLILTIDPDARELGYHENKINYNRMAASIAAMPWGEERAYQNYIALDRADRGDFVGRIVRIVMAVFVLALFLLIDGSPETLGLGLFLGFEAFAMSLAQGWLPIPNREVIVHYCYQMGDIFRLYFFLQMARLIDKNVKPWIIWGSLISIPYGVLQLYANRTELAWVAEIPNLRDLIIGCLGVLICARSAIYLRDKNLPWRVIALWIAVLGSAEQAIDPLGHFISELRAFPLFVTVVDITQPLSAWLLAFSAFINISTLENRVKILSEIASQGRRIEAEMELAKSVQQAFFRIPEIPSAYNIVCHHEAMMFVSGDIYFVDWNEKHQVLSFVITDVTGHGLQAALKASGVSVIANSVWAPSQDEGVWQPNKIQRYATQVNDFYQRMGDIPDIVALGGAEFDARRGMVRLFRQNFPFPILVLPKEFARNEPESRWDDTWVVKLLATPNEAEVFMKLVPGSFVVITSDGFVESSRTSHEFMKYLRKHLARASRNLTAEDVRNVILACQAVNTEIAADDRTFTIFQWHLKDQQAITPDTEKVA